MHVNTTSGFNVKYKIAVKSNSANCMKIHSFLTKVQTKISCLLFMAHGMYYWSNSALSDDFEWPSKLFYRSQMISDANSRTVVQHSNAGQQAGAYQVAVRDLDIPVCVVLVHEAH